MKRFVICLVVVLVLGGAMAPTAAVAGGWAVVELEKPLPTVLANKEATIQFRVLGHGQPEAMLEGIQPTVLLIHRESKARTRVEAVASADDPALYEASFTLKKAGAYKWNITPEPYAATAMPTLRVYETAADAKKAEKAEAVDGPVIAVKILEGSYSPAQLVVAPGTTVEWTNTSVLPHQVVWSGLELDDSAILHTDETMRITFEREGLFTYYCGPHPYMTGEILVSAEAAGS